MDYSSFENIVVRTPLHSFEVLKNTLNKGDLDETIKEIMAFYEQDINKEALFIASPDLFYSLENYEKGNIKDHEQVRSIMGSLLKYMTRMATRSTPFGLFAGCSVGKIGKETNLILDTDLVNAKHTRLDMNYVCALAKEISTQKTIRKELRFYPNSSLYEIGETLRYIERRYKDTRVTYHILQVEQDDFLSIILKKSKSGVNISTLIALLIDDEVSYEEAETFIFELIDNQLLIDELEPSVCGDEFYDTLIMTLQQLDAAIVFELNSKQWQLGHFITRLLQIKELLHKIDKKASNFSSSYEIIIDLLKEFGVKFELNRLFQTDLIKKSHACTLSTESLSEIKQCLKVINRLTVNSINPRLENFAKAFQERYEDKEMPLMQVLDTEYGIGYAHPTNNQSDVSFNNVETLLLKKLVKSLQNQSQEIEIKEEELSDFSENWHQIPDTLAVMIQLLEKDDKLSFSLSGGGGSSAANLLGRFCHADKSIGKVVQNIVQKEDELKAEEVIYAEINHITEARTGNILSRPVLRNYEIPFLAKSNLTEEYQLTLSDLMLSVRQNKIVIRSKKTNKIVIPRLTNAHNYHYGSTQPIYQFLGDFQNYYETHGVFFSWGKIENMFDFLPRVTFKNHILSKAKWVIKKQNVDELIKTSPEKLMEAIEIWRQNNKIPSKIMLSEGDNELLIDLKNALSVSNFIATIKNRESFILEEFLFDSFSSPISDENNNQYLNQLILLFHRNKPEIKKNGIFKNLIVAKRNSEAAKREFLPGDEWIYFKIYCGTKVANTILINLIRPFAKELEHEDSIEHWFFIRYADPDFHIRVRFKAKEIGKVGEIISRFYHRATNFYDNQQIRKIVIDTYVRELERYGSNTVDLSEAYFAQNSAFVLNLLSIVDDFSLNWLAAISYIDRFLTSLELDIYEKKQLFENLAEGFGREFNKDIHLKKKLGNQFREEREKIKKILEAITFEEEDLSIIVEIVKSSLNNTKKCIDALLASKNQLEFPLHDLLGSYLHMFLNRVFEENQRYHEMVLYHMMWYHYKSEIARNEEKNSKAFTHFEVLQK